MIRSEVDTITAIATPGGHGSISVIRISGPKALQLAQSIFKCRHRTIRHRRVYLGTILDPITPHPVDQVLLTYFKAPYSYTGEDIVEISCHGGSAVTRKIVQLLIQAGARAATAGEFTRRAFLNGKLDLSQAEAVLQLTHAENEQERRLAMAMLSGGLSQPVDAARLLCLDILAGLELDLDFPEEEPSIPPEQSERKLQDMLQALINLQEAGVRGSLLRRGFTVVLTGPVNAGKSRLFNSLIGADRAIVTDEPGTTRDLIEGVWSGTGISVTIVDTAGLRKSLSAAESEGVRKSVQQAVTADLVLYVVDVTQPDWKSLESLRNHPVTAPIWCVCNKIDLLPGGSSQGTLPATRPEILGKWLPVSAKTGDGIMELRRSVTAHAESCRQQCADNSLILSLRQQQLLAESISLTGKALAVIKDRDPMELAAAELRSVYSRLGQITGDTVPPDVLDHIFSRFCIGK